MDRQRGPGAAAAAGHAPGWTARQEVGAEERGGAGGGGDLVRVSIGHGDAADVIDDRERGLRASQKG